MHLILDGLTTLHASFSPLTSPHSVTQFSVSVLHGVNWSKYFLLLLLTSISSKVGLYINSCNAKFFHIVHSLAISLSFFFSSALRCHECTYFESTTDDCDIQQELYHLGGGTQDCKDAANQTGTLDCSNLTLKPGYDAWRCVHRDNNMTLHVDGNTLLPVCMALPVGLGLVYIGVDHWSIGVFLTRKMLTSTEHRSRLWYQELKELSNFSTIIVNGNLVGPVNAVGWKKKITKSAWMFWRALHLNPVSGDCWLLSANWMCSVEVAFQLPGAWVPSSGIRERPFHYRGGEAGRLFFSTLFFSVDV